MPRLKKIIMSVFLVICFASNARLISAAVLPETKIEQYTEILDMYEAIGRIQASKSKKDNLAAIRVGGTTFNISSSIVNGFLVKDALPEGPIKLEAELLYPAAFNPISVMDLLYLYSADYTSLVEGANLQEKIAVARNGANRKLIEKMIKMSIGARELIIQNKIEGVINGGDASLGIREFNGATEEKAARDIRLLYLKNAIVDFLHRLRKYSNDIAFIPTEVPEQYAESHHLLSSKENFTKLNIATALMTVTTAGVVNVKANDKVGAIELLISKIDTRILRNQYHAIFSARATARLLAEDYAPLEVNALNIVGWILELYKLISSPWNGNLGGAAGNYMRAITHTEQMVDWISSKFGGNILVKISGKAPCFKCSHYIQYADTVVGRVVDPWNLRTIIGFNTGWRNIEGENSERDAYRYPVKVFNAAPEFNIKVKKFQLLEGAQLFPQIPGTYDADDFDGAEVSGISKSNCYAIDGVDTYEKQLRITGDGSVEQLADDRDAGDPILLIP